MAHTPTGPVEQVPGGTESEASRQSGPRFPRPHLQRIETEPGLGFPKRLATGSISPPIAQGTRDEFLDEDKTPVGSLELD